MATPTEEDVQQVTTTSPPPPTPASFVNTIDLFSINDSKIAAVSVYSGRAEITRLFKFLVKTGQNHVNINGLPSVLDDESVRVEGRGPATIHDVTVGEMPDAPEPDLPPALVELTNRKNRITKALERSKKLHGALGTFLSSLKIEHIGASELDQVVEGYESTGGKLDERIVVLEYELKSVEEEIVKEEEKRDGAKKDKLSQLRSKVSLSLFAEKEGEVELVLIYAVLNATWTAVYDVRVDMQATKTPVMLVYKAAITQDTAEDWDDVPLTLETATPTFQVEIPTLNVWTLTFTRPVRTKQTARMASSALLGSGAAYRRAYRADSDDESGSNLFSKKSAPMRFRDATVTSKGNVSATFTVPGTITIPSDDAAHNVTITQLELDATMSWIAIPKVDARARLSAKITNASEYTLLAGVGSIYVDGSFISKSNIPAVSPGETFDCALGLDPAIRITYHPVTKKTAQTGFYTKTTVSAFAQRVSIHNTKSITVTDLRIIDQIPVSSDDKITVKLISPGLSVPARIDGSVKGEKKAERSLSNPRMKVAQGVAAEWGDGMEDPAAIEDGTAMIGQDGKLSWICEMASQAKTSLVLQWEVTAPARSEVYNL